MGVRRQFGDSPLCGPRPEVWFDPIAGYIRNGLQFWRQVPDDLVIRRAAEMVGDVDSALASANPALSADIRLTGAQSDIHPYAEIRAIPGRFPEYTGRQLGADFYCTGMSITLSAT